MLCKKLSILFFNIQISGRQMPVIWMWPRFNYTQPSLYKFLGLSKSVLHQISCRSKDAKNLSFSFYTVHIQWGSEIRTSLDFEWSKRGWVANGPEVYRPFEIRAIQTKTSRFQMVRFWTVGTIVIAIAKAQPFEFRPSKSLDVRISNVFGYLMVWFQIPTVSLS